MKNKLSRYSKTESFISNHVKGMSARSLVEELENSSIEIESIKSYISHDLKALGFKSSDIHVDDSVIRIDKVSLTEDNYDLLLDVCNTYSRTYPEVDILVSSSFINRKD